MNARLQVLANLAASTTLAAGLLVAPAHAAAPLCFGKPATIVGTAGPDSLRSSDEVSDVIWGAGGNDYISGGDFYGVQTHPDLLCGGPGDDRISGSPGNDKLSGGQGADYVRGERGSDVLHGNDGNDNLVEESIADSDAGDDVLRGGAGDDRIGGGWGRDQLFGDGGADEVIDAECDGPTVLNGGAGDDYLESWSSSFEGWHGHLCSSVADRVSGGTGTDTAEVDRLDAVTYVEQLTRILQGAW